MNPEQRERASLAVRARMNYLRLTVPELAARAGIDKGAITGLLAGSRWPRASTLHRMCRALDWPLGEISRRAEARPELAEFTKLELLTELCRREKAEERPAVAN